MRRGSIHSLQTKIGFVRRVFALTVIPADCHQLDSFGAFANALANSPLRTAVNYRTTPIIVASFRKITVGDNLYAPGQGQSVSAFTSRSDGVIRGRVNSLRRAALKSADSRREESHIIVNRLIQGKSCINCIGFLLLGRQAECGYLRLIADAFLPEPKTRR